MTSAVRTTGTMLSTRQRIQSDFVELMVGMLNQMSSKLTGLVYTKQETVEERLLQNEKLYDFAFRVLLFSHKHMR